MSELVRVTVNEGVQYICFNRVQKKNAITLEMYQDLTDALRIAEKSADILVSIIHGNGMDFTAGNDISEFMQIAQMPDRMSPTMEFLQTLSVHPKPLLAAVEGRAIGVGATLLLHCDMVFAAQGAKMQFPFVRLGVVPEAASSFLLPSLAGHQIAFEKLILGEAFDAEEAKDIGMVNHLCADGEALVLAENYAQKIVLLPPEAVMITKSLLKKRFQDEIQMSLMREGRIFKDRLQSKEARDAFSQFLARPKLN